MSRKTCLVFAILAALAFVSAYGCEKRAPGTKEVTIYAHSSGTINYVLSFALADLLSKNSTWLRASVVETTGTTESMLKAVADPKGIGVGTSYLMFGAKQKMPPFQKGWDGVVIGRQLTGGIYFISLDPSIKTVKDMAGKRVVVGASKTAPLALLSDVLFDIWGIKDKVKIVYLDYKEGASAMVAGEVDTVFMTSSMVGPEPTYAVNPPTAELMQTKKVYFVEMDPKELDAYYRKTGYPSWPVTVPAGRGFDPNKDVVMVGSYNPWISSPAMEGEIVEEILRILYDYAEKFAEYHALGKSITREGVADMPFPSEDYHPAASKFLKDRGIKIGGKL